MMRHKREFLDFPSIQTDNMNLTRKIFKKKHTCGFLFAKLSLIHSHICYKYKTSKWNQSSMNIFFIYFTRPVNINCHFNYPD